MLIEISNGFDSVSSDKFTNAAVEVSYDSRRNEYIKRFSGNLSLADGENIVQFLEENLLDLTVTITEGGVPITTPVVNGKVSNVFRDLTNKVCMLEIKVLLSSVE